MAEAIRRARDANVEHLLRNGLHDLVNGSLMSTFCVNPCEYLAIV